MEFGEKIRSLRCEKKLSQQALADVVGISLRSIQNYESGTRHPSNIIVVKDIASALDVSYEYLLDDKSQYVLDAAKRGGVQAALDVDRLKCTSRIKINSCALSMKYIGKQRKTDNERKIYSFRCKRNGVTV